MAKTIKEMAEIEVEGIIGKPTIEMCTKWYIKGANAALDEIEKILSSAVCYGIVRDKIRELKGE